MRMAAVFGYTFFMDHKTDAELALLLISAQAGDQKAYEEFLHKASEILRSFLKKKIRDPEKAEDVLQETLMAIHKSRHTFLRGRQLGPWLYTICSHRMLDYFRKQRRLDRLEVPLMDDDIVAQESPAEKIASTHPLHHQIVSALDRLPAKQKEVIRLLKIEDLSVKEVAAHVNMSESAVKVTAFRGYQAIRKFFGGKNEN